MSLYRAETRRLVKRRFTKLFVAGVLVVLGFSYLLQARPGAYVWLGQGGGPGNCFLHNPRFDFNDEVIPLGAGYLAALVEEALPLK